MRVLTKPARTKCQKTLDAFRIKPCLICGEKSDPCHIRSKGAGGGDDEWNLLSLCRGHHTLQHSKGWKFICRTFPSVEFNLSEKGWYLDDAGKMYRLG